MTAGLTKEAPMGTIDTLAAAADRLEAEADTIAGFVRTPRQAVALCAFLLRLDAEVEGQISPQPEPAVPELLAAPTPPPAAPAVSKAKAPSKKQTAQKPGEHPCPDCDRVFNNMQGLGRHRQTRHPAPKIVEEAPAATADDTLPKVDTTADRPPASRSTSAGVASMCLSGSHAICLAATCSCECHGGPGRSEAA